MTDVTETGGFVPIPPDTNATVTFLSDSKLEPPRILEDLIDELEVNPFKESMKVKEFFEGEHKDCVEEQEAWLSKVIDQCDSFKDLILTG